MRSNRNCILLNFLFQKLTFEVVYFQHCSSRLYGILWNNIFCENRMNCACKHFYTDVCLKICLWVICKRICRIQHQKLLLYADFATVIVTFLLIQLILDNRNRSACYTRPLLSVLFRVRICMFPPFENTP